MSDSVNRQNTFCKIMSNALSFRIPGDSNTLTFNPCCLYDDYIPFHPTIYKRERDRFINATNFLPGCDKCILKENTSDGRSLRTHSNSHIPDGIGDSIYRLEVVVDTTCNAACIHCTPQQSSLWRNEIAKRDSSYIHIQNELQIDNRINLIKNTVDIQRVKNWHFWGGEPLLTDTHLRFISEIENKNDVDLTYTTNGSIFPDDNILKLWEKFRSVLINISVDGIDDQFHYMRWPLSWNKVKNNIELFNNDTPSNLTAKINYCFTAINVLYTKETCNYFKDMQINYIPGLGVLDVANTPMKLRETIYKQLGNDHIVSNVLKELPIIDASNNMLSHLNHWDSIRKLDWRNIFPETSTYF